MSLKNELPKAVGMEVSIAISEVVKQCDTDVIAAYPITPQTHIVEHLADLVANGELDAEYIPVESEHSAMSACMGSAAAGARTFTATAAQGLEYMHEALFVASAMRLPIVMAIANRALSAPISVWGDHSDVMAARDCGWISFFAENGQEAVDLTVISFKVAEDPQVLLPVFLNIDGFHLSHMIEPIIMPSKEEVQAYLPPFNYPAPLHPSRPVAMGECGGPNIYTEAKKQQWEVLEKSLPVIKKAFADFAQQFGRCYQAVETYHTKNAKTILLTMGSFSETAMSAVDKMRRQGRQVGLLRLRLFRPFPFDDLREAVKGAENLIVLDRALSMGGPGGPVMSEVKSALYGHKHMPKVAGIVGGLGGREITVEDFEKIFEIGAQLANDPHREFIMYGVKE